MKHEQKIPFMAKVKDNVTGITGKVTAYLVYFTGCVQYEVVFLGKHGDEIKDYWIDEERLEILSEEEKAVPQEPRRRSTASGVNGGPSRGPSGH